MDKVCPKCGFTALRLVEPTEALSYVLMPKVGGYHIIGGVDCNVRNEEARAEKLGLVLCPDKYRELVHALRDVGAQHVSTARPSWSKVHGNTQLFVTPETLQRMLNMPASLWLCMTRNIVFDREAQMRKLVGAYLIGEDIEKVEAALVLIALDEDPLLLMGDD